ncbi:hypothetical protein LCGC14_1838160 [marine sediment metagenome]|uniref:CobQ/CobB/MinD/ParA nucleotide binding domain-containing protein n=1 Tax=marine sediment metagenome TaxID=412755 RepID=A0A0F9ITE4_9ZZZZ
MMAEPKDGAAFRLYTLHSQKGGVGKTSLAIAIAGIEALLNGRKVLLLDADMTGTCVADALGRQDHRESSYRYLNDMLLASPDDFLNLTRPGRAKTTRGRWAKHILSQSVGSLAKPTFDVIASNPWLQQVRRIIPSLAQECHLHHYAGRLQDLLLTAKDLGYEVVIIDLPPGMFGLSLAAFGVAADGLLEEEALDEAKKDASPKIECFPIAVTTTDAVDYKALFPTVLQLEDEICQQWREDDDAREGKDLAEKVKQGAERLCEVWFNKAPTSDAITLVGGAYDAVLKLAKKIPDSPNGPEPKKENWLGRIEARREALSDPGAVAMPFVGDFRTERILQAVRLHSIEKGRERDDGRAATDEMFAWVAAVKRMMDSLGCPQAASGGAKK